MIISGLPSVVTMLKLALSLVDITKKKKGKKLYLLPLSLLSTLDTDLSLQMCK